MISTSGKKKSFQIGNRVLIATTTSAGRERDAKKGRRWRAPASSIPTIGNQAAMATWPVVAAAIASTLAVALA
ncbi:hypothetical protein, partial [Mesorhizobium sp.]|uniref:hypothetical protein n=1 Tax=Mesorhizobium sp. TaxID=1871066 RepID=UPI0025FDBB63